jgi:TetR/AcrR family transcriptional regulator, transcriptional repressor of bet genes
LRAEPGLLVHVAYFVRAVHDERLRETTRGGIEPLRVLLTEQLRRAIADGEVSASRDADTEAVILICLAHGLANHALLETHSPAEALEIVDAHLASLFGHF